MAAVAETSTALAKSSTALAKPSVVDARPHSRYTPSPIGALIFYAFTGQGIEEWVRMRRNTRVLSLIGKVLLFAILLVLREWLFERADDSLHGRE